MIKKFLLLTLLACLNASFLLAQDYSVYVISPAVGTLKNEALKEIYVQELQKYFDDAKYIQKLQKYFDNGQTSGIAQETIDAGINALIKSPNKDLATVGKVFKARKNRFLILVSVDEISEELCSKLKFPYSMVSKVADGVVTLSLFDKQNINITNPIESVFVTVGYGKLEKDINKIKEKYSKQIDIKTGLECGIQTHTIDKYEALLKKYNFDFIIFSVHQVDNKEFWTQDFQRDKTQKEYNEAYYKEMLEVVKSFKNYSVLGHLDLIIRYDKKGIYPFEKVKPIIEDILKIIIEDGKGIEFNTSYTRYGLKDTTPSIDILKLYYKLGGNIITIGSDSHQPSHLGFHINEAKEILKNIGFKQFCTYNKMIPEFHNL